MTELVGSKVPFTSLAEVSLSSVVSVKENRTKKENPRLAGQVPLGLEDGILAETCKQQIFAGLYMLVVTLL